MKIPKITGIMPVHNVISGHFPFLECILLNLPLLDELIIYDGGSIDGTIDIINELSKRDGRIKLVHTPFKKSKNWRNIDDNFEYCMSEIATGDWIIALHADEFFHPNYHSQILQTIYKAHNNNINCIRHNMYGSNSWKFNKTYNIYPVRIFRKQKSIKADYGIDSFYIEGKPTKTPFFIRSCLPPEVYADFNSYHIEGIFDIGDLVTNKRHLDFYGIDNDSRINVYHKMKNMYNIPLEEENFDLESINWIPQIVDGDIPKILPKIFHGLIGKIKYEVRQEVIESIQNYKKLEVEYNENVEYKENMIILQVKKE